MEEIDWLTRLPEEAERCSSDLTAIGLRAEVEVDAAETIVGGLAEPVLPTPIIGFLSDWTAETRQVDDERTTPKKP